MSNTLDNIYKWTFFEAAMHHPIGILCTVQRKYINKIHQSGQRLRPYSSLHPGSSIYTTVTGTRSVERVWRRILTSAIIIGAPCCGMSLSPLRSWLAASCPTPPGPSHMWTHYLTSSNLFSNWPTLTCSTPPQQSCMIPTVSHPIKYIPSGFF